MLSLTPLKRCQKKTKQSRMALRNVSLNTNIFIYTSLHLKRAARLVWIISANLHFENDAADNLMQKLLGRAVPFRKPLLGTPPLHLLLQIKREKESNDLIISTIQWKANSLLPISLLGCWDASTPGLIFGMRIGGRKFESVLGSRHKFYGTEKSTGDGLMNLKYWFN